MKAHEGRSPRETLPCFGCVFILVTDESPVIDSTALYRITGCRGNKEGSIVQGNLSSVRRRRRVEKMSIVNNHLLSSLFTQCF